MSKKSANRLGQADKHRLNMWLISNATRLQETCPTRQEAADEASAAIGVLVTIGNIEGAQEATGVTWTSRPSTTQQQPSDGVKDVLCGIVVAMLHLERELFHDTGLLVNDAMLAYLRTARDGCE